LAKQAAARQLFLAYIFSLNENHDKINVAIGRYKEYVNISGLCQLYRNKSILRYVLHLEIHFFYIFRKNIKGISKIYRDQLIIGKRKKKNLWINSYFVKNAAVMNSAKMEKH